MTDIFRDARWRMFQQKTARKNCNVDENLEYERYITNRIEDIFSYIKDYPETSNGETFAIRLTRRESAQCIVHKRKKSEDLQTLDLTVWGSAGVILDICDYCSQFAKQELFMAVKQHRQMLA